MSLRPPPSLVQARLTWSFRHREQTFGRIAASGKTGNLAAAGTAARAVRAKHGCGHYR